VTRRYADIPQSLRAAIGMTVDRGFPEVQAVGGAATNPLDMESTKSSEAHPRDIHPLSFRRCGAVGMPYGWVRWRVWAPTAKRVDLILVDGDQRRAVAMVPDDEFGHFVHSEPRVVEGQRYAFSLDGGADRPDPCSLWQPDGVDGPSAVVHPARFHWTDANWRGVPRADLVFYELHVGTFTPQGTFEAIIPRLNQLKDLGVTAIELMPVNQFPGSRNWGYDGVLPYAAQNTYGGPYGLQKLVDACHAAGIAVFLDVVYNHFGPEGNYLHEFGPYFTDKYKTPWGKAVNYDDAGSDGVRDFVLDNARMWLEEFHFDGLRLDAVHAIYDLGARHILRAIKDVADAVAARQNRTIEIVAESDQNDPRIVSPAERGGHGLDAQWADDFHHAVHSLLTGELRGYYSDYGKAGQLAQVLDTPFLHAGTYSPHRKRKHGAPPNDLPGDRFVVCIQNHDQVGNRAKGDRLTTLLNDPAKIRLAASLMLLSPYVPLLFMGEEYAEDRPFPFFCSFCGEELIRAVREGRKKEFAELVGGGEEVPLPDAEATFRSAELSWSWPEGSLHAGVRRMYQDLLAARRAWRAMRDFTHRQARLVHAGNDPGGGVLELTRGEHLRAYFNLDADPRPVPAAPKAGEAVLFSSELRRYSGPRETVTEINELRPHEAVVIAPTSWATAAT
jgi:maltooligosyltrehalose trehalohydrolase